jgi:hypothetical protein
MMPDEKIKTIYDCLDRAFDYKTLRVFHSGVIDGVNYMVRYSFSYNGIMLQASRGDNIITPMILDKRKLECDFMNEIHPEILAAFEELED